MAILTWLHLSDWHQGGGDFDRKVVSDTLLDDIKARAALDPNLAQIDFVFFTGDLAYRGQKAEYEAARDLLLEPVRHALNLPKERLFLIPGNHDLDRSLFRRLPCELQQPFTSKKQTDEWLTDKDLRSDLLKPFRAYQQFISEYGVPGFGDYGDSRLVDVKENQVGIVGMNSALMCGRNKTATGEVDDKNQLTVGEPQIHDTLRAIAQADVRIALIHHPVDWLSEDDGEMVETRLQRNCHFILRGHVHRQSVQMTQGTQGNCVIIPGGACYNGRIPDRPQYINAYNYVSYGTESRTGTVYLRRWNLNNTGWTADTDRSEDGKYQFTTNPPTPGSARR